jgi:hypothetical protein
VLAAALAVGAPPDEPKPAPPDLLFYVRNVARFLEQRCGACHASGAGGFRLVPRAPALEEEKRLREEFREVARHLDPAAPWSSRLILKALDPAEGGLPHAGGAFLRTEDEEYDTILDFASGATLGNLPPEPEPGKDRRVAPGVEVRLDGSLSYDRDEDKVTHRWELFAAPVGSKTALRGEREAIASLTPDVPGTYVVRLRVSDGKVWSAPRPVVLEALDRVGPVVPDPVAGSGLEALDGGSLRLLRSVYGDVLGRPPTPPEALAQRGRSAKEVAATLLATVEAGRAWLEDVALALDLVGENAPGAAGLDAAAFRLAAGKASAAEGEAALVRDPSFVRAHPPGPALADALLVRVLARDPLGPDRDVLLAAFRGTPVRWLGREGVADPRAAIEAALASGEFAAAAARRHLARFLPRAAADAFPAARAREPAAALALEAISSAAYAGAGDARRAGTDLAFVRAVFADLLGRRPTAPEAWALVRAANVLPGTGAGRAAVVAVLLGSGDVPLPLVADLPDPDAWVADRFRRYLGRSPSAEEATAYRSALLDPDGGPQVLIRALLTTPEYAAR